MSETSTVEKPRPQPNELSAPYWEGAARGELVLQKCADCGTIRHYPRLMCAACQSRVVTHVVASGNGKVHSWTVAHHPFHPAFRDELPYTMVTIDLEEGVRALGRWKSDATPFIGQAVKASFIPGGSGDELWFAPV